MTQGGHGPPYSITLKFYKTRKKNFPPQSKTR
jgi:hypothetical protein